MKSRALLWVKGKMNYGPNIGRDEDDDGERAEPGVSNGEENVSGDVGSGEIFQGDYHHPHC
jgi:hypothetical protein